MDNKISVSEESIRDISKKLNILLDSVHSSVNMVKKSIDLAEMEGWTDRRFLIFREEFEQSERFLKEGTQYIEDILLPEIKRIQAILEGY